MPEHIELTWMTINHIATLAKGWTYKDLEEALKIQEDLGEVYYFVPNYVSKFGNNVGDVLIREDQMAEVKERYKNNDHI